MKKKISEKELKDIKNDLELIRKNDFEAFLVVVNMIKVLRGVEKVKLAMQLKGEL